MQPDLRLGAFDDLLAAAPQHAATLRAVRTLVEDVHPQAVEVASRRETSVWWGWDTAKNSAGYAWCMPHRSHVNFGFMQGAHLPDPQNRLQGTGKSMRHVKLTAAADLADPAIRHLLVAARDERRAALNIEE